MRSWKHKGFTLCQPKKTGSTSQKSTHPVRKCHQPIGRQPHGCLALQPRTNPVRLRTCAPRVRPPFKGFPLLRKLPHHTGSLDRHAPRTAYVVVKRWHMLSTGVRMARRLGIHEGGQGGWGKKDAGIELSGGVKHWDKWTLGTALERVVFTSSRTARLELRVTQALDAGNNWKWFQFGLEGNWRIDLWSYAGCGW